MAIRESGDWEGWVRFFLRGAAATAEEAARTAGRIVALREDHRLLVQSSNSVANGLHLLDRLYQQPIVTVNRVQELLGLANYAAASRLVNDFVRVGLLEEITGGQRNRVFRYTPYIALFAEEGDLWPEDLPVAGVSSS
jgi:Fic family protein